MLKNKYLAIVLSIIAIILIANLFLKKEKKGKTFAAVKLPPMPKKTSFPMMQTNTENGEPKIKQKKVAFSEERNLSFSPYEPLKIKENVLPNPSSLIWGKDPFGPVDNIVSNYAVQKTFQKVFLSAIIIRKNKKIAVINNIVFKEGDLKGGILLKKIENSYIIIVVNNKEITLKIFEKKEIPLKEENKGRV